MNGGLRAGAATKVTVACSSASEGIQRYNYLSHAMEFCNGSNWMQLPAMATGTTANVTASGPPVSANTYAFSAVSLNNLTTDYGTLANVTDGVWPANGGSSGNNAGCFDNVKASGYVLFDLGSVKTINKVYLSGDSAMQWGITFSADGTTFSSGVNITNPINTTNSIQYLATSLSPNVTARYVRLTMPGGPSASYETFCEFAVGP